MKKKDFLFSSRLFFVLLLFFCSYSFADTSLGGGQTITITNSLSRCVLPQSDLTSITITSIKVGNDAYNWPNWLKSVSGIGAKVDLSVTGPTGSGQIANYPIGKTVDPMRASDVDPKILRGTVNISVLSKYKLSGPSGSFSHIDMPLTLARIDNNAGMKALFDGLTQIAKIAPFPAEPFQAVTEALSTLTADIFKANNNKSDAYPSAILGYELVDDVSECSENPQALRTGAQAQIFSGPEKIDGVIDIGKYNNYCYYATVGSDPNIVYAPAPGDGMCPATQPAKTTLLLNPQIIFVVNAYPINKITKPAAVAISPTATIAVSDISKNKSSEFSEFARKMQNSVGIPNQYLGVKDLSSLLGKIKAIGDHPAQTRTLVLSAQDRATLALSEAFRNCALVGLSADKCH